MNQRKMGVVLSYASMLMNIGVGLITVPLMTHFMGTSEYGLYELMGSLIAYMSVMDFGLSSTITRYYSQAIARRDEKAKQNILAISAIIYLAIALLGVLIGACVYQLIGPIYAARLTPAELIACKRIFIVLIFNMAVTISGESVRRRADLAGAVYFPARCEQVLAGDAADYLSDRPALFPDCVCGLHHSDGLSCAGCRAECISLRQTCPHEDSPVFV